MKAPRSTSRRKALCALGAGVLGWPLLASQPAAAANGAPLTRFVGVYLPHGCVKPLWRPRDGFDIGYEGSILAPFDDPAGFGRSFRDQLVVLEGLDLTAGMEGGTAGHDGSRVILTGSAASGKNASLDQFLAVEQGLGAGTPLASLVLGVGDAETGISRCISYARGGAPLPKIIDPARTFDEAFAKWVVGADPLALARAEIERRRGASLLDALRADLQSLRARADRGSLAKLDQHATALRELEKRLVGAELGCVPPARPASQFPSVKAFEGGEPYFDAITDLQIDLLCNALACDVTRFATLYLPDLSRTRHFPELPEDIHFQVAHPYSEQRPETWAPLARQNHYACSKVARMLQRLHEFDLLETTVVFAASDMGDPSLHSSHDIAALLAGGGAAIQGGRRLNGAGTPHNRLLVSLCQAFGVGVEAFGESDNHDTVRGALSDLV